MSKRFQISAPVSQCPEFIEETIKKEVEGTGKRRKWIKSKKKKIQKKKANEKENGEFIVLVS